jgi:hypothetical protein
MRKPLPVLGKAVGLAFIGAKKNNGHSGRITPNLPINWHIWNYNRLKTN